MNRSVLLAYQLLIGLSDATTGALLLVAPELTLHLMRLNAPADALPYVSFIGAFVFSVGLACLYGAYLVARGDPGKLDVVWLLKALTRASVAIVVLGHIFAGTLEAGWISVAITDGACVVFQAVALRQGWAARVAR